MIHSYFVWETKFDFMLNLVDYSLLLSSFFSKKILIMIIGGAK